ncbi:unnamed protein product [Adineta ricciae]|uniref:Uncharacterized protein n=1 Tax=Adineta ricciae TaxID=249248 RepID=A0A815I6Z3_ADIRI|nr:unnamed protein product [Adineta ricciae]
MFRNTIHRPDTSVNKSVEQQLFANSIENLKIRLTREHIQSLTFHSNVSVENHFDTSDNKSTERQPTVKFVGNSNISLNNESTVTPTDNHNSLTNFQSDHSYKKSINRPIYKSNQQLNEKSNDNLNTAYNCESNETSRMRSINAHTINSSNLHNSSFNNMTSGLFSRNPKIVSFINSLLNSKNNPGRAFRPPEPRRKTSEIDTILQVPSRKTAG